MSATPVFHNLWPTTIMSVTLPGSDMANPVLSEFINELDDERSNLTINLNQQKRKRKRIGRYVHPVRLRGSTA